MKMTIREAVLADFPTLLVLFRQLWPGKEISADRLHEVFSRAIASQVRKYFCAEIDGEVIGTIGITLKPSLWQEGTVIYIEELVVHEKYRSQGIGTRLMEHVRALALTIGCERLELDSAFHRVESHRLYERWGMEKRAFLFTLNLKTPNQALLPTTTAVTDPAAQAPRQP